LPHYLLLGTHLDSTTTDTTIGDPNLVQGASACDHREGCEDPHNSFPNRGGLSV